jgi:hypothetical protein
MLVKLIQKAVWVHSKKHRRVVCCIFRPDLTTQCYLVVWEAWGGWVRLRDAADNLVMFSPGNFYQVVGRINKYKFYHDGPRGKYRVRTDLVLPNGNTLFSISRIFLTWGGTSTILPKTRSTAGGDFNSRSRA